MPAGVCAPDYEPFGRPRPKTLKWGSGRKVPAWLRSGDRPEFTTPEQYVAWTRPVWLWAEGRDGLFLLSSSFLILDMGYWANTVRGQVWSDSGLLYLYLATHTHLQVRGAQALSLTPRAELGTLADVNEPEWVVDGTKFTGVTSRPDCYVASRALPWQSGLGSVAVLAGSDARGRGQAIAALKGAGLEYFHAHKSPVAARNTFRADLWVSENKPCDFVVRDSGWWNVGMTEIFNREAPPVFGQMELLPCENWQEFDVDAKTGAWAPVD